MIKKISYERRIYESVDDNSLSKAISQKTDEENKSCNKGLNKMKIFDYFFWRTSTRSLKFIFLLFCRVWVQDFEGRVKVGDWIGKMGNMTADQTLSESEVRQLIFELDSAYNAFNRLLQNT